MKRLAAWLSSWATTLHIMFFERETYRYLRASIDAPPEDFVEMSRP
ncbi:MAG TPA: hypothetical protein VGR71_16895 [Nitrospira sp.]|nr:hypothetical protein [Nitrospira sp.]